MMRLSSFIFQFTPSEIGQIDNLFVDKFVNEEHAATFVPQIKVIRILNLI